MGLPKGNYQKEKKIRGAKEIFEVLMSNTKINETPKHSSQKLRAHQKNKFRETYT